MSAGREREFTRLLEEESARLASYILALVGDRHVADDAFQSTCLKLWRIRAQFRSGTDFGAWSRTVARYEALRHWQRRGREKLSFSTDAVARLADAYAAPAPPEASDERMRRALAACLEALPARDRDLVRRRYNDGIPIRTLAEETARSENALKMVLLRLRRKLKRCIRARLARAGGADARAGGADG
ncbi:MAG: sigma-70 family RNA polymerase sigma factor [Planctomycetes bacterium]|nr:sigma-70 family RNA polymerase sigma factor [Planctomycetota bacterium]